MFPRPRRLAGPLVLAGALGALFSAGAARAQVLVTAAPVTTTGALFNYSYSVTNLNSADLAIVNLNNIPMVSSAVTDLMAPAGFQISFDPGVGILSFLPDLSGTQAFSAGSVVSGFSFSSTFGPGTVAFDAEDANGGTSTGTTLAPVPEASSVISLGAGVLLLAFCAARRRRTARSGAQS